MSKSIRTGYAVVAVAFQAALDPDSIRAFLSASIPPSRTFTRSMKEGRVGQRVPETTHVIALQSVAKR
jgi:hypothetical protein